MLTLNRLDKFSVHESYSWCLRLARFSVHEIGLKIVTIFISSYYIVK